MSQLHEVKKSPGLYSVAICRDGKSSAVKEVHAIASAIHTESRLAARLQKSLLPLNLCIAVRSGKPRH